MGMTVKGVSDMSYNGWATYETWVVALWMQNDEYLYNSVIDYVRSNRDWSYHGWRRLTIPKGVRTPENTGWVSGVNVPEIEEMMKEMGKG